MSLVLGKCLGPSMKSTVKVLVPALKLDTYFNMYFRESQQLLADDNGLQCCAGDWLLVRQLPQALSIRVKHRVERVVYKAGRVVDPLTDRQSLGYEYADEADRTSKLFGRLPFLDRTLDSKKV